MEEIIAKLLTYPSEYLLLVIAGYVFLTSMGLFLGHNDLTIISASLLASTGHVPLLGVFLVIFIALFLGETISYLVFYNFGDKLFRLKILSKLINSDSRVKLQKFVNAHPTHFLGCVRISPVLRPYLFMLIGSSKLKPRLFFSNYLMFSILYCSTLVFGTYFVGKLFEKMLGENKIYGMSVFIIIWAIILLRLAKKYKNTDFTELIHT